ncbi:hypothetical protein [Corallococcus sp. EGB]|uniref:hypothetical protein n=1 Tax=Corallococcus sp. EGB TaxID=1521117 RepID=UPI001CBE8CC5|nr:hypothetical protein [Corallococcus sp. EGB]
MAPAPPWLPAVQNNAEWCDTVCRAHGHPGRFEQGLWLNPAPESSSEVAWRTVGTPEELEAWEAAWSGQPEGARPSRVFPPALLQDEGVVFLAAGDGKRLVAGGIAFFGADVIGLSNTFRVEGAPACLDAELLARLRAHFPGRPVVGYERGEALDTWRALGFEAGGPLRVWLRREG